MPRRTWSLRRRLIRMPVAETGSTYSIWVGLIYIFNIIVGTGALTLPAAFASAGWILSTISLLFLAFMSFLTATYIIETLACANAVLKWKRQNMQGSEDEMSTQPQYADSEKPLVPPSAASSRYYSLDRCVELGEMAKLFFNRAGLTTFYIIICTYLYGDLAIYGAAVAKSLMDIVCIPAPDNMTSTRYLSELPCFNTTTSSSTLSRLQCYRIALVTFVAAMTPFVFSNLQRTKYLQLITSGMRWLAFAIMISMAIHFLRVHGPRGHPSAANITGLPTLFGACVYAFMCHHSLPGFISPIRQKQQLQKYFLIDYSLIAVFYLLLAYTGAFAFANLHDLYTLNFIPIDNESVFLDIIEYFLALFPVFTLCTSFPVISITLRNNLRGLFLDTTRLESYSFFVRKVLFPVVTIVPPLVFTLFVEDIGVLIKFTGSYAGTGIQYLIPTFLVLSARKQCANLFGLQVINEYKSPFCNKKWAIFVLIWAVLCITLCSYRRAKLGLRLLATLVANGRRQSLVGDRP